MHITFKSCFLNQDFGLCFHLLLCFLEPLFCWSKRGIISQNHIRVNWIKNPPLIIGTNIQSFEMEPPQRVTPVSRDLQNCPRLLKFTEKSLRLVMLFFSAENGTFIFSTPPSSALTYLRITAKSLLSKNRKFERLINA